MAFFRYVCVIQPKAMLKLQMSHLKTLILMSHWTLLTVGCMHLFVVRHFTGYSKPDVLCRGRHVMEMYVNKNDPLAGKIAAGVFHLSVLFVTAAKILMYCRIFAHLYRQNQKQNLGLTVQTMKQRRKKNVITLYGELMVNSIAIFLNILSIVCYQFNFDSMYLSTEFFAVHMIFSQTLLCIGFIVASPEILRYLFKLDI